MAQYEERNCAAADDGAFVSSQAHVTTLFFLLIFKRIRQDVFPRQRADGSSPGRVCGSAHEKNKKIKNRTPVDTVNRPRFLKPELTRIQIKLAAPGEF